MDLTEQQQEEQEYRIAEDQCQDSHEDVFGSEQNEDGSSKEKNMPCTTCRAFAKQRVSKLQKMHGTTVKEPDLGIRDTVPDTEDKVFS